MASLKVRVGLCITISSLSAACASDDPKPPFVCKVTAPTECPSPAPTYQDVQPIIEQRCVTCHSDTSTDAWPLTSYQDVADWCSIVRDEVLHCTMPPVDEAEPLTTEESQAILEWVRCDCPR